MTDLGFGIIYEVVADSTPPERAPTERAAEALYHRVKTLTRQQGTSVTKLGKELGYSRGGLRNTMKSSTGPNLKTLLELASHLGFRSIEELFGDFGSATYLDELRSSDH